MSNKPSAFLIMPFEEEFDSIYVDFLKPTLEEVGFEIIRADDIQDQQNILKSVVDGINRSDLIVADLTTNNPNVFYELGLAHALQKPVILVTQSIDEVPFDLKSYRLLEYSTYFSRINDAKRKLKEYGKGFLQGKIQFGSPVTDFLQDRDGPSQTATTVPRNEADEDERGFIDHLIDINDGYIRLGEIGNRMSNDVLGLTQDIENASSELKNVNNNPTASSPAAIRRICRRLAERMESFNSRLKKDNTEYTNIAQSTEDSLEFIVTFQLEGSGTTSPELDQVISSLLDLKSVAEDARDVSLNMANVMDELPRMERRLNRAVDRGSQEIRITAGNLDKTVAAISRALTPHA